MKLTRDMAIFDDKLPLGVKLVGYALGFTLTVAVHIDRVISASNLFAPYHKSGWRHRSACLELKQLSRRK